MKKNKFNKLTKLLTVSLITIISISSITGCSTKSPKANTALKINGSEQFITSGKMTSPWKDINIISRLCFRNIFTVDALTNNIKADLATTYTLSDDGLIYTLNFRDDLIWSDGEKITLDDVIFSFKAVLSDSEHSSIFSSTFSYIEGTSDFVSGKSDNISGLVMDGNNLIITLDNPITNFPHVLAQFTVLPKHVLKDENLATLSNNDFWLNPVVSGMYKVGETIPDEQITYIYNDKYKGDIPNIYSIIVRDDYEFSDLDYYTTNDISEIMDFRAISYMKEYNINSLYYKYFVYNIDKNGELDTVINDLRIRQAIAYAIDNETIVSNIYFKTATPIDSGLVSGSDRAYTYDPEKSRQLLAEANYDFDRPLVLFYDDIDLTTTTFMSVVAQYLQAVGFKVELIASSYLDDPVNFDEYDVVLKGLSAFDITEWYGEYHSSHDLYKNFFGISITEPVFNELIDNLNATITEEDRLVALEDLQKEAYQNLYKYPIFMMGYKAYTNESRLTLPDDVTLGNPRYKYDNAFEEWILKTDE